LELGRWNGVEEKLNTGETVRAAAIRETQEEIGVNILCKWKKSGGFRFYFPKPFVKWNQRVTHFYS